MATLCYEKVWTEKPRYDEAECLFYEKQAKAALTPLAGEIAKARLRLLEIRNNFPKPNFEEYTSTTIEDTIKCYEKRFDEFGSVLNNIQDQLKMLGDRMKDLERLVVKPNPCAISKSAANQTSKNDKDDDDDVDLFGSDSEEESADAAKIREERLAAYNAKKSKKPVLIAKSNIILDVKPWDDDTDMKEMEKAVRKIETDGLLWGAAKLVPLAYGIHKLQISCVVEDEKVSVDWLQEQIEAVEDFVQSVDIAAFNKV